MMGSLSRILVLFGCTTSERAHVFLLPVTIVTLAAGRTVHSGEVTNEAEIILLLVHFCIAPLFLHTKLFYSLAAALFNCGLSLCLAELHNEKGLGTQDALLIITATLLSLFLICLVEKKRVESLWRAEKN